MFCSNCGKQINMQSKFCTGCGVNLQNISNNVQYMNVQQNTGVQNKKKSMKRRKRSIVAPLLSIILSIALLVTGTFGYLYFKRKSEAEKIPKSVTWHGESSMNPYASAENKKDSADYFMEYEKNEKGQIKKVVLYDENGDYVDEIEYEYDSKGRSICEHLSGISFSSKGMDIYFDPVYKEWDGDLLIKTVYFEKDDYEKYEYDNKGNMIRKTQYDAGKLLFVDENTLDDKGRVIESRRKYRDELDDGIITVYYEYDGDTDNYSRIVIDEHGIGEDCEEYEYEYDSKGRIITKETMSYHFGVLEYSILETFEY